MAVTDNVGGTGNFSLNSTTNTTAYTTLSVTPVANDLIVLFVAVTDSTVNATISDTQSLGWDRLETNYPLVGAHRFHLSVAQTLAAATSMTITFDCTGDTGSGAYVYGRRIAGGRATAPFHRQHSVANGLGGTTPAVTFENPCNTNNGIIAAVFNLTNPATLTNPTSWTEVFDVGHATPDHGMWYGRRLSGETGTTITWGSTSGTDWIAVAVEIYVTGQPASKPFYFRENVLERRG